MPTVLDRRLVVLHHARLRGIATVGALAAGTGLAPGALDAELGRLRDDGLIEHVDGRVTGFRVTPAGRAAHEGLVRAELASAGCRASLQQHYERFLVLNPELVATCTAWQVRDLATNLLNDHADAAYDAQVLARLGQVHTAAALVCDGLGGALPRFSTYGPRFTAAIEKVRAGAPEWFARPSIDSYHTVWMELHEDLLVTLGIERSNDVAP